MRDINPTRIKKLIDETTFKCQLDCRHLTVLTEAATGYYFITPVIAALAGAQVIAYATNSNHSSAQSAALYVAKMAKTMGVADKIRIVTKLSTNNLNQADIVTNLGSLRPIDKKKIRHLKDTAVIPVMYESWELRYGEIDLLACRKKGILVLGTNENASQMNVLKYVKLIVIKMILENNLEIIDNNFLVISCDKFGHLICDALRQFEARTKLICASEKFDLRKSGFNKIDAVIVADYSSQKTIIGKGGIFSLEMLGKLHPEAIIIQFAGRVDGSNLPAQKVAQTYGYLGPKPLIELQTAGLKVGEEMARAKLKFPNISDINKAKKQALKNPLCQDID